MVKARGTMNGKEIIILGLSHANLDYLRADGMNGGIYIKGEQDLCGLPFDIYITAGTTEAEISSVLMPQLSDGSISTRLKQ